MSEATRAVIGAGAWGTTLAVHIGRHAPVVLVTHGEEQAKQLRSDRENKRYLPGVPIPSDVELTPDPTAIAGATEIVMFAVPADAMREAAKRAAPSIHKDAVLLSVAKGIERGSLLRMTEVIEAEVPAAAGRVAALSGPNLAGEIARRLPASSVVAAQDESVSQRALEIVGSRSFRLYRNRDVIGVELCGALKNIIAIAAGAVDGLGFGDNGKAGLITRGLAEMTRLGIAAGANPLTFAGLAGLGDVIATCASPLSRNRRVGEELAKGRTWKEIEGTLPGVAEGAYTVDAALAMAERFGVEMPIAQEVHNALFEGKSVQRCLADLLARESKDELADFEGWVQMVTQRFREERAAVRPGSGSPGGAAPSS